MCDEITRSWAQCQQVANFAVRERMASHTRPRHASEWRAANGESQICAKPRMWDLPNLAGPWSQSFVPVEDSECWEYLRLYLWRGSRSTNADVGDGNRHPGKWLVVQNLLRKIVRSSVI